jgi:hypothetical protein
VKVTPLRRSKRKRRIIFTGVTIAYRRFIEITHRTERLLEASELGVREHVAEGAGLLARFKDVPLPRGRLPRNHKPQIRAVDRGADGSITLQLDGITAAFMKRVLTSSTKQGKKLRFHFCAALFVYAWAAFETYIAMLLKELYQRRPELLKSENALTSEDAISHRESLIDFLIEQQLIRLGKLRFGDTLKYLRDRLGVALPEAQEERLRRYYILRNVVAHNTGLVAPSLNRSLPAGIRLQEGEVRIGRSFLRSMLRHTKQAARTIEQQMIRKFYRKRTGSVVVSLSNGGRVAGSPLWKGDPVSSGI